MKHDMKYQVTLRLPHGLWCELNNHLFRGDGKEHGAVLAVSVVHHSSGYSLLGERLFIAEDGTDYIEKSTANVYTLTAGFVRDSILRCRDAGLSYLAVHNHGGRDRVAFSNTDMRSHKRGYPALLDILKGEGIVGALVLAENAIAGDIWLSKETRRELDCAVVVGPTPRLMFPQLTRAVHKDETYDRQIKIFGEDGQAILRNQKVGVVGLGGIGSLINQYLAKLGVGHIVAIDEDSMEPSNLSRIVGANRNDVNHLAQDHGTFKVEIAKRVAREANPNIFFSAVPLPVQHPDASKELFACDAIFLAADSATARLVVNALCHQYLIPVWQVGSKVQTNGDIFSVVRLLIPGMSCMSCSSNLIDSAKLSDEAAGSSRSTYVQDVPAPSVITLNGIGASLSVNNYLFYVTSSSPWNYSPLTNIEKDVEWIKYFPASNDLHRLQLSTDPDCQICKESLGVGGAKELPGLVLTRQSQFSQSDRYHHQRKLLTYIARIYRRLAKSSTKLLSRTRTV